MRLFWVLPLNANDASLTNFTLPTAYNSLNDIAEGDYMTFSGSRKRNSSDNSVSLEMQRKMVRIVVNVSGWGDRLPPAGTIAGNSYEYSLQIGKNAIVIKNISVTDWKTGEAIPGGEASIYE